MSEDQRPPDDSTGTDGKLAPDGTREGDQERADRVTGNRLGDFELLRELGRGGMGVVYEARQISLNRRVALKVLPPGLGLTDTAVQRFGREARAAAGLHHTNIVPVYAIGEKEGSHFYVMELIEGEPLSRVLNDLRGQMSNTLLEAAVTQTAAASPDKKEEGPSPTISGTTSLSDTSSSSREWFDTVARILADVADALHYAHDRGVIHRDVKPANLMLSQNGRLCLTDFGLARVAQEPGMTVSGSFLGTPAYMSPEQIAAGRVQVDHRSDIYSLGAVLYEMLSLRRPFTGESRDEILNGILTKDPRPPRRFNPRIPIDLETICQKAMEKDRDRRYQSAGELAADLRRFLQRGLITARRASLPRRIGKSLRRHPVAATATVAAVLLVLVSGFAWRASQQGARQESWRLVSEAKLAMSQGSYRDALRKADAVLAADSDQPEARVIRARSLIKLGRPENAISDAERMIEQNSDDWIAHALIVAAVEQGFGFYGKDLQVHVDAVESLAPDSADAYTLRALVADDPEESLELLNRALQIDPGYVDAVQSRARTHLARKDFQAALEDAERLTLARPRSAMGWHIRGRAYWELHDFERADAALERAIQVDPDDPFTYAYRAIGFAERGDFRKALANIDRSIEMDPENVWFHQFRANWYQGMGRHRDALEEIERAIELSPDDKWNFDTLARIQQKLGDPDEARRVLDRLAAMAEGWTDPETLASMHRTRSSIFGLLGDHQQALSEAALAVEVDPDNHWNYLSRAAALRKLEGETAMSADCEKAASLEVAELDQLLWRAQRLGGQCNRPDLAIRDYSTVIGLAPHWPDPYRSRGWLYRQEKHLDAALDDFDRVAELAPNWAVAWSDHGVLLADADRFEEALEAFTRRRELGDNSFEARFAQASALISLGRDEEALAVVDETIEEAPELGDAYLARALAAALIGRLEEALEFLDKAIETDPEDQWQAYMLRAEFSKYPDGEVECAAAAADLQKALEVRPGNPRVESNVAVVSSATLSRRCPALYDAEATLSMARRGVEFDSNDASMHHNLGVVLYRNGLYEEACQSLLRSIELSVREEPYAPLVLAMANWKLGNKEQARAYYDRSVARMEKTMPKFVGFLFYRKEAAEVLGI